MRFDLMAKLAWHDYRADAWLSLCAVLSLVAVITPLLVLFGLKYGMVTTLTKRLTQNPAVREVVPLGGGRYSVADITVLAQRPDVAFVVPRTRQIAATADLYREDSRMPLTVEMIPTAEGDPLLAPALHPLALDEVVLSQRAAEKLGIEAGSVLIAAFGRQMAGREQYQRVRLRVRNVLPLAAFSREALFAPLALLEAVEDYRDGQHWRGVRPESNGTRVYPGFRLYARDLDDVESLRRHFAKHGLEVATQADAIAQVRSLSRNLSIVFWIIAGLAIVGAFATVAAGSLANVERKRKALSVLRLLGFPSLALVTFVVLQALYTGVLGLVLASLLYGLAEIGLNRLFDPVTGEYACRLLLSHFLLALLLTLLCSLLAAAAGGWRSAGIEASEGLRDV